MDKLKKYVVNLKRRPDRLETFKKACPFDDVELIYGFDGKFPRTELPKEVKMFKTFTKILPGERGCFISHLRIYEDMVKKNIPCALIMEDDAIFCEGFKEKVTTFFNELPKDFVMAYVGGRFIENFIMQPQSCISISPHVDQHRLFSTTWVGGYDHDRTTHAYIITNEGATMLHKSYKVISEMSITVDDWMLRILTKNNVKLYNARPHLCYSPIRGDSDIR